MQLQVKTSTTAPVRPANLTAFVTADLRFDIPAIKADAKTLVDAVKQYENALRGVNYDFTKLTPAQLQAFRDPNVASAGTRVTAYLTQVCHVTTATSSP